MKDLDQNKKVANSPFEKLLNNKYTHELSVLRDAYGEMTSPATNFICEFWRLQEETDNPEKFAKVEPELMKQIMRIFKASLIAEDAYERIMKLLNVDENVYS